MTTYFTQDHEWIRVEGDTGVVGITPHAVDALGDIAFFDAHPVCTRFPRGAAMAVAVSDTAATAINTTVYAAQITFNDAANDALATITRHLVSRRWRGQPTEPPP